MKICSNCKVQKEVTEFHTKRGKPQAQCKECRAKYMQELYKVNREREVAKRKAWYEKNKSAISEKGKAERKANPGKGNLERRLRKYGITKEQYNQKLVDQNNVCALCQKPFMDTPAIDHCHETLIFRGLLHDNCNTGFGLLKEDVAIFQSCIAYALKYKK